MSADDALRAARTLPALFAVTPEPPLDRAAFVLARDAYPQLDVEAWLGRLDALATPLTERASRARGPEAQAALLGTVLYDELGFHGNEEAYYDPRNSYLNEVIESRRGIPITLALVMIALGRRAGMDLVGIAFPGHFLVRLGGGEGPLLDPFFRGRILTPEGLDDLGRRALGASGQVRPEHLAPASARLVVGRMLHNLKNVYESHKDHARALLVCDRLVDLTSSPEARRDRARHALQLGAAASACADLEAYLTERPGSPDEAQVRALLEQARRGRSQRPMQ